MSNLLHLRSTHTLSFALMLIALLYHPLPLIAGSSPDFNGDGIVDKSDLLLLISVYGSKEGDDNYDAKYDLDGDGVIAQGDLRILIGSYGQMVDSTPSLPLSVCERTPAVRDSIMTLASVSTCGDVTAAHLSAIDSLSLAGAGLTALKAGDFSGLTELTNSTSKKINSATCQMAYLTT